MTTATVATAGLMLTSAALALAEIVFQVPTWNTWAGRLAVLAALLAAGVADLRTKRVPRAISYSLLIGATGSLLASANVPALILLLIVLLDLRLKPGILETSVHVVLLGLGLYLGFRVPDVTYVVPVVTMLLTYHMWRANWLGGGDGQLLIALSAVYPDPRLLLTTAAGLLAVGTFWIIRT
ncbi:MAG: prepilin peptidase, partial [Desulfotignum sp.]